MANQFQHRRTSKVKLRLARLSRTISSIELRKYLFGSLVWSTANQMVTVTQTFVIFDITQSALQLAILGAAVVTASVLASMASGILADRLSRKTMLMAGQVIASSAMLTIGFLILSDRVEPWHIQVAGAIQGGTLALDWTARFSLLPNLVSRNILPSAVSFDLSLFNLGRVMAPLVWGLIVNLWGYEWTYFAIALFMIINFFVISTLKPIAARESPIVHQAIWRDIIEIASVVKGNSILSGNLIFTFVNALLMGGFIYLLTPISQDVYQVGSSQFSILFASVGFGAFIGGLFLGLGGGVRRTGYALLGTNVLSIGGALAFGLVSTYYLGLSFALMYGLTNAIHIGLGNIALQVTITDNVRGRLAGIYELAWAGFPAGGFAFGVLANNLEPTASLIIGCGFVFLVTIGIGAFNSRLRNLRIRV